MGNEQTAVEWLVSELEEHLQAYDIILNLRNTGAFEIAKQVEKDQIINAWAKGVTSEGNMTAEQYYNEIYGR